jgi:hypothetical protein
MTRVLALFIVTAAVLVVAWVVSQTSRDDALVVLAVGGLVLVAPALYGVIDRD